MRQVYMGGRAHDVTGTSTTSQGFFYLQNVAHATYPHPGYDILKP